MCSSDLRSDAGLDAVVSKGAKLETLATGFGLNEGPVWINEGTSGYLLVSGLLDNVIYKITPEKKVSVFMERAGFSAPIPAARARRRAAAARTCC